MDAIGIGIGLAVLSVPLAVPLAALVFIGQVGQRALTRELDHLSQPSAGAGREVDAQRVAPVVVTDRHPKRVEPHHPHGVRRTCVEHRLFPFVRVLLLHRDVHLPRQEDVVGRVQADVVVDLRAGIAAPVRARLLLTHGHTQGHCHERRQHVRHLPELRYKAFPSRKQELLAVLERLAA